MVSMPSTPSTPSTKDIESMIVDLLNARKSGSSICPSDVARALSKESWRELMPAIRECADNMVEQKILLVTQKGHQVSSAVSAKGPIRLRFK